MTPMTPETAQALEPGTTPGPWEWKDDVSEGLVARAYESLGNDTRHALETQDAEDYASWAVASDEDKRLIAAAPDMRATIASEWQYGVQRDFDNLIIWRVHQEDAESLFRSMFKAWNCHLVRRLVGPTEPANTDQETPKHHQHPHHTTPGVTSTP